jgi:hypothetical protein
MMGVAAVHALNVYSYQQSGPGPGRGAGLSAHTGQQERPAGPCQHHTSPAIPELAGPGPAVSAAARKLPQALTHLALISAAFNLDRALG